MKIESKTVQIPTQLFIQLVKYFGNTTNENPIVKKEQEQRKEYIIEELIKKSDNMKKREDYKNKHSL